MSAELEFAPDGAGGWAMPRDRTPPVRAFVDPVYGMAGKPLVFDRSDCRTLADIIAKVPLRHEALRPFLRVKLEGELIAPDKYRLIIPKHTTFVTVVLPVQGGDNLLATIAVVALVGASLFVGGFGVPFLGTAFAAGSVGANLVSAGLSLAASMLLQGLAVPQANGKGPDREELGNASAQNAFEPGAPIPRVAGACRLPPPMAMPPYTELDKSDQYVTVVYMLGGPHAISDIRIGDAPIDGADDVEVEIREGFADDLPLTLVTDTRIEQSVNLTLSQFRMVTEGENRNVVDDSVADYLPLWHRVQTKRAPDIVKLLFALPQGLARISDSAKSAVTSLRVRMRRRGDTTWINLPEFILKAKAPGIPIRLEMKLNFIDLADMPGSHTSPPTPSFTDGPRGWYQWHNRWPVSGTARWTANSYFTTYAHAVNFIDSQKIELFLADSVFPRDEAWEIELRRGFVGSHALSSGYSASAATYDSGNYADFYATRTDSGSERIPYDPDDTPGQIVLAAVQSIWNEYPFDLTGNPLTLVALRLRNRDASQVTMLAQGYTEDWDGVDWVPDQLTRNPAAWYREALRSEHSPEPVPDSLIEGPELVDWHEWNTAEGHTFDMVIQGDPVPEVLVLAAQAGFARPRDRVKHGVIIDRPRSGPVGLITQRNAWGFSFEKAFSRLPHALKVQLTDAEDDFKARELIVYADGFAAVAGGGLSEATRFESVVYRGIKVEANAIKRAQRDMRFARHRGRLLNFNQDIEHLGRSIGEWVLVETDIVGKIGGRGRVVDILMSGDLVTGLVLDEAQDFTRADADGAERGATIRLTDESLLTFRVTDDDTDPNTIVFASPFAMPLDGFGEPMIRGDDVEAGGTLVVTGALAKTARDMLLWDMAPGPDHSCQVVAIDYAEEAIYGVYRTQIQPMRLNLEMQDFAEISGEGVSVEPLEMSLAGLAVGQTITEPLAPMVLAVGTPDVGLVHAATAKYLDQQADISANSTTRTIAINGGARTGKSIVVLASRRGDNNTNVAPATAKLNGVDLAPIHSIINGRHYLGIWITDSDVITDGTDSIVAAWASVTQQRTTATIFPADGLSSTTQTARASSPGTAPNVSLAVSKYGLIIAGAFANSTTAHSWTGITEDVDNTIDAGARASAASLSAAAAAGTVTITATLGANDPLAISAAFR